MSDERSENRGGFFTRLEPILQHEGFAYTFSLVYILTNVIFFLVGAAPEWRLVQQDSTFMKVVRAGARGGGALLNLNSALVILVASKIFMSILRRTPLNMVVPFDKAMPLFHASIGTTISVATFVHVVPHLINYSLTDLSRTGMLGYTSLAISGAALCVIIGVMRFSSTRTIRNTISYELWYAVHISGFILYFSILIIHGTHHGKLSSYKFVGGPLVLYFVDNCWRRWRNRGKSILVPGLSATTVGKNILKLRIARTFDYLPGQYCYINIPEISRLQWHPFSIASSPHESHIVFYIKVNGDWTAALYEICSPEGPVSDDYARNIGVYIRGPFGAPAQHVGQYEHVILVSGGVGATPFTSITKYAHHWIVNHTASGYAKASSPFDAYNINYGAHTAAKTSIFNRARFTSAHRASVGGADRTSNMDIPPFFDGYYRSPDSKFLSKASSAANNTIISLGRTLMNAAPKSITRFMPGDYNTSLGNPHAPIPERWNNTVGAMNYPMESGRHGDLAFEENDIILDGKRYEDELIRDEMNTASIAIKLIGTQPSAHLPYSNITDDGSESENMEAVTWNEKLLVVLHSVTLNWLLFWMMMLRFVLVIIGRITHSFELKQRGLSVYGNDAMNIMDLVLSLVLFLPVFATIASEMVMYGVSDFFYRDLGNGFDFFLFLPLSLICVLLHGLGLADVWENSHHVSKITVLAVWPILSLFLVWRIVRTIGSRVTLAQYLRSRMARTKSLDFLWVSKTHEEDSWLLAELLPIASSDAVRVHRFLTKSEPILEDWMRDYTEVPLKTTYERPNWNKVFDSVVEKSKSGSVIGVFFCGPHRMARAVQQAAMRAMQKSVNNALKRGYDEGGKTTASAKRSKFHQDAIRGGQFDAISRTSMSNVASGKAAYGCNIRISVRVENFS